MPSESGADALSLLLKKVREVAPNRNMLLISDHPPTRLPRWIEATLSSAETLAATRMESRRACGLVLTPLVEPENVDAVIARSRDFLTRELYVLHPGDALEQARRMGALGLRLLDAFDANGQPWGLSHFSLKTYKKTPNWLNSRHWANPRLWDRFRW